MLDLEPSPAKRQATSVQPLGAGVGADVPLHASIYEELRHRLVTGRLAPGSPISTRGLAKELGVSQMPAREAVNRLAAEGAIEIRSKRQIKVPAMTADLLDQVVRCRVLLEPEAAIAALPHITPALIRSLRAIDTRLDAALQRGDVVDYMDSNFQFHFQLYRAGGDTVMSRLIHTLWLRFGPMMRVVYGRVGTAGVIDQHVRALKALQDRDAATLHDAIRDDILDGLRIIQEHLIAGGEKGGAARRPAAKDLTTDGG